MNRVSILVSILCACSISMAFARVNGPTSLRIKRSPLSPRTTPSPNAPRVAALQSPQWPRSATSSVIPAICAPEAGSALCGYVQVPLDRKHPICLRLVKGRGGVLQRRASTRTIGPVPTVVGGRPAVNLQTNSQDYSGFISLARN